MPATIQIAQESGDTETKVATRRDRRVIKCGGLRVPAFILAVALGIGVVWLWLRPGTPGYFADRAEDLLDRRGPAARAEAVGLFRQALARDPASPYRWCDLAETLAEAGQTKSAEYCFRRAVEAGPRIPPILMRAANYHFTAGQNAEALACTSRILSLVREYDAVVFSAYARMGVPGPQILDSGLPPGTAPRQAYFRSVLVTGDVREANRVWNWLERAGHADTRIATEYCDFLLQHREYARASAVWQRYQGGGSPDYPRRNRVFDGGFESEPAGTGLGWRVLPVDGVTVERTTAPTHGGAHSLQLTFSGRANLAYGGVVERTVVEPGNYRFRAFLRAEGVTTDQGVRFVLSDPESPGREIAATQAVNGTVGWTEVGAAVTIRAPTRLLEIRVSRRPSLKFDDKIRGTVWIDDVQLRPAK
jgi:hypothetical protein